MWGKGNSCTVGGNINEHSHYGEQYGHSLKTNKQTNNRRMDKEVAMHIYNDYSARNEGMNLNQLN